jgi:hypothetical protein
MKITLTPSIAQSIRVALFISIFLSFIASAFSQELYVFSNPASNVPANSLSFKYGSKWVGNNTMNHSSNDSRHMLESQLGINKKIMLRAGVSLSDMYSHKKQQFESFSMSAKYRFFSNDNVHRHFRAAFFLNTVFSKNDLRYDELTVDGDQSVVQGGIILTQLINKLALSTTLALTEVINPERWEKYAGPRRFGYQGINYSFSSGYLLFPKKYTSYKQPNLNIYFESIGGFGVDKRFSYTDLAPALQLILNSNSKINLGYRFQLVSDAERMARSGVYFSFERTFLNALKHR